VFTTPLFISSYNIKEYLAYKANLIKSSSDFQLNDCLVTSGGRNHIWYIKETFENQDFLITFRLFCKKAKEKEDGFHCKKCSYFDMEIRYTDDHLKRIMEK
jgi:hypothetical protein